MSHVVKMPDDLYRKIEQHATEHHEEPEALIVSWVADAIRRAESPDPSQVSGLSPDEPLVLLAGIITVPDADAGDHHDLYVELQEQQP